MLKEAISKSQIHNTSNDHTFAVVKSFVWTIKFDRMGFNRRRTIWNFLACFLRIENYLSCGQFRKNIFDWLIARRRKTL